MKIFPNYGIYMLNCNTKNIKVITINRTRWWPVSNHQGLLPCVRLLKVYSAINLGVCLTQKPTTHYTVQLYFLDVHPATWPWIPKWYSIPPGTERNTPTGLELITSSTTTTVRCLLSRLSPFVSHIEVYSCCCIQHRNPWAICDLNTISRKCTVATCASWAAPFYTRT